MPSEQEMKALIEKFSTSDDGADKARADALQRLVGTNKSTESSSHATDIGGSYESYLKWHRLANGE